MTDPGTDGIPNFRPRRWALLFALLMCGNGTPSVGGQPDDTGGEAAIAAIAKVGGKVRRDESLPGKPVVSVDLRGRTFGDEVLVPLEKLTGLRELLLGGSPSVTDASLPHLKGLTRLQNLDLSGTRITERGLGNLQGLTDLEMLNLSANSFGLSDAEVRLDSLTKLQKLDLSATGVKVARLRFGRGLTRLQTLDLADATITDVGLAQLEGLTGLRDLNIGVDFPGVVTDAGLKHLKELTNLRSLNVVNQAISKAGLEELRKALPHTDIIQ